MKTVLNSGLNILLVEDDNDDLMFFQEAIKKIAEINQVTVVRNRDEMFSHIEQNPQIDVVFMDINLPLVDGKECLRQLKSHQKFKDIPVIMFTGSSSNLDIDESYEIGAHYHIVKPYAHINYVESLKTVLAHDWKVAQPRPSKEQFVVNLTFN